MAFYQKHTDFDSVVIEPHDSFSGLVAEVSGSADTQVRSCLLANSNGFHMLELYEVSKPRGRSIPFHTLWGDYGYLEAAYVCDDLMATAKYWIQEGIEFICHPTPIVMDDVTGWFMYGRDPDGIPVEIVEIPPDFLEVKRRDMGLANEWRMLTRSIFEEAFDAGYVATDFVHLKGEKFPRSYYVLSLGEATLNG